MVLYTSVSFITCYAIPFSFIWDKWLKEGKSSGNLHIDVAFKIFCNWLDDECDYCHDFITWIKMICPGRFHYDGPSDKEFSWAKGDYPNTSKLILLVFPTSINYSRIFSSGRGQGNQMLPYFSIQDIQKSFIEPHHERGIEYLRKLDLNPDLFEPKVTVALHQS